ncbi:hypothetical protein TTHERM_01108640 (macronuclear) [Tetrahymena thermophila SB210]|uniref:Uncharacterized protein n=1 Tax=Tetrahymena thermophila (strain SB210) TaxID=312017 RepID=Q22B91_TETTS|nr:hypothetical protein TTHERM_01108640 [Tetrahymena thermophila SB210]EAR82562.1 hypothetical protein TTHERM_01108640 [Tetrahymena thermophila SB210]|eukprot:XP_001030225.1 hypothetical protein TTHERM_01108640 [Tetrahymena thermophila SB210]
MSVSQIEIIQPDNSKANFILFPKRLSLTKDNESASKRRISGSVSNYNKIFEKIQSIQMLKDKSALGVQQQPQSSANPVHLQRDCINSTVQENLKNNYHSDPYPHQKQNIQIFNSSFLQQNNQQPIYAKQTGSLLPAVLNLQQQQKESFAKKRSISSQSFGAKDYGQNSTPSTASSQNNDSSGMSYNTLLRSSINFNNQNSIHSNNANKSVNINSSQKLINCQQQHYFSDKQTKQSHINQKSVHFRNNTSNQYLNTDKQLQFENVCSKNQQQTFNQIAAPHCINIQKSKFTNSQNTKNLTSTPDIQKLRNSDTFSNSVAAFNPSYSQQPLIKERRIIRVNSILKKKVVDQDQFYQHDQQFETNNLATSESFEENNSSQVIAKNFESAPPFINDLDITETSSSQENKNSLCENIQQYQKKAYQIVRKRCNSASPKKCVKFDENVLVCNMHTSTKTQYKLSQKEMKQELIQQCSQFRKDLRLLRMQYQNQQQQQQKIKHEQLMYQLNELMTLSQQNQNSDINLQKFGPTLPIKQYTKFKVLSKLDKNQEQEKYLQKIEQIDKQYKQNLALKLQTTYSIKYFNQMQQNLQQQQPQQQINQNPLNQQQQQYQMYPNKPNPNIFNNSLIKNLISQ